MAHGPASRFDSDVYARRLARAAELTVNAGLDALVVGTGPDLRYLTGAVADTFERLTAMVIPASSPPRLIAPRMELA
ncbi:aminopeptidase P family N-terminal domain-containing protein, partial [Gordonia sp. (in: high G+C Gram-positive bacteria)]|uniref:aminopeptidase P family N-terminal domain-containing protein n=1 Tax=Gordonia sp. (in: high G+C Gram-positive bacteria) TaxID=84139 RepID=UPI00260CA7FB